MKNLLITLAVALMLTACGKEPLPENPANGKLDPNKMITLRQAPTKDMIPGLTALEIVQNAVNIKWTTHYGDNFYYETPIKPARTFTDQFKDFNKPALLMWGTDIIQPELLNLSHGQNVEYGMFLRDFIDGFDVYITDGNNDSIAHIPNEVLRAARPLIWQAYSDSNYTEVYRLFDEAFTFIPIPAK